MGLFALLVGLPARGSLTGLFFFATDEAYDFTRPMIDTVDCKFAPAKTVT